MWDTVAIIGVGLIGGSIGLALRRRSLANQVVGVGRRETTLRIALQRQAVTAVTTDLERGVAEAELVVVCTPVESIADHALQASRACRSGALITDAGSTKANICRTLASCWEGSGRFVGAHPLAGSEKTGPQFAEEDLFQGGLTVVTPVPETPEEDVLRAESFWNSLGSRVLRMTPEAHDEALAATSHLPHLVAATLAAATPAEHLGLAATGWYDTTRIAAGDTEVWRQILLENRDHVLRCLENFEKVLSLFRQALARNDRAELVRLLEAGKQRRDVGPVKR